MFWLDKDATGTTCLVSVIANAVVSVVVEITQFVGSVRITLISQLT